MKKFLVGIILITIVLASCTPAPVSEEDSTPAPLQTPTPIPQATSESTQPAPGPTVLRIWIPPQFDPEGDSPASDLLKQRLDSYISERPDLRIETRVKASSGTGGLLDSLSSANAAAPLVVPDLILLPRASLEIAALKGLLFPYDGLTDSLEDSDWYPYAQELAQLQTSTFGLPFAGDALVALYRPSEIESHPADWPAALEAGHPIAFPAAEPSALFPLAQYLSTGAQIQNTDGRPLLESTPLTELLSFFRDAETAGVMPFWLTQFTADDQSWEAYTENQVNSVVTWISRYLNTLPGDTAATPILTKSGSPLTLTDGWVWALSNPETERRALSVDLAEYLTDGEFLSEWSQASGYLPPRKSALEGWTNVALRVLVARIILSARIIPPNDVMAVIGPALSQATVDVLKQQSSPISAADDAIATLENP